jgi:hypothetical protein
MAGGAPCKIVTVLVGDNPNCEQEINTSLNMGIPVIVLEGSALSNVISSGQETTPSRENRITNSQHDSI